MIKLGIKETYRELIEAIHNYANAAVAIERDGAAWDSDVEPFTKVEIAIVNHMLAAVADYQETRGQV